MFCERCGRILKDGELTCPECGAYYGPVDTAEPPKRMYFYLAFVISAAIMTAVSYYMGFYALLCMLLFWTGGRPRNNFEMVLRGLGFGITLGCAIGITATFLL